nr:hypothetical protein [uncultured Mediterranean phage uvMED]
MPSTQKVCREIAGEIPTDHKQCFKCKEVLPFSNFYKNKRMNDLHCSYCKSCDLKTRKANKLKSPFQVVYNNTLNRAKLKNFEHNLDVEYLKSIDRDTCPYLNVPISFGLDHIQKGEAHPYAKSLDRIDSSKGYIKGNVVFCSMRANMILSNATAEEMLQITSNFFKLLNSTKPTNAEN